jgi:hypothetical protein
VQNRAQDWYFENIANPVADVSALPDGTSSDQFVSDTLKAKAMPVITIPTLGLMPFDRTKRCGFSVAKYGAQNRTDGDCGNGKYLNGSTVVGNDVSDTTRAVNASYALGWLDHLASTFGQSMVDSSLFILDNEVRTTLPPSAPSNQWVLSRRSRGCPSPLSLSAHPAAYARSGRASAAQLLVGHPPRRPPEGSHLRRALVLHPYVRLGRACGPPGHADRRPRHELVPSAVGGGDLERRAQAAADRGVHS